MTVPNSAGDPDVVPTLIAQHIVSTASNINVTADDLSAAISEITPETQTLGAALLQVQLIDPRWKILRSGLCDLDENGFLQKVDVNYPEGTPVWWRLAMIDWSQDPSEPNLTLTFQHRIVSYLMNDWGPLGWPGGRAGQTRAQFIKMLADRIPKAIDHSILGPGSSPITFVCPAINEIQPVAGSGVVGTEVVTAQSAAAQKAGVNKLPGVTAATQITIKGAKPDAQQLMDINTAMGEAASLQAGPVSTQALLCAGIAESAFDRNASNQGHNGIWQSDQIPGDQVAQQAQAFLQGGSSFQGGGAIKLSQSVTDPGQIATTVEAGGQPASFYSQWLDEAKAIINAYDGGLGSGSSGVSATPTSDIAQLTRGTPDDPDEDSWTCMQRLASEVNWNIFTSPQPHPGQWGNYLYFMDGPDLAAQRPSLYISLSDDGTVWSAKDPTTGKVLSGASDGMVSALNGTADNTAFVNEVTKAVKAGSGSSSKGKAARQTRIRTPQTPTQQQFSMIAGVLEFNAGDVFVFQNAGPANGRWIVEDVTHNSLADLFAQFTLGPPTFPYPEPQASSTSTTSAPGTVDISGYVRPFLHVKNLSPERIDMGVDYNGTGDIVAIGDAKIYAAAASGTGWTSPMNTQAFVGYTLSSGTFAGKSIYVAEDITIPADILSGARKTVKAGDVIATFRSGTSTGIETGWATGKPYGALAAQLNQQAPGSDPGAWSSACGRNFNEFLTAIGETGGILTPNPPNQSMPADWPKLGSTPRTTQPPVSPTALTDGSPAQLQAAKPGIEKAAQIAGIFESIFSK